MQEKRILLADDDSDDCYLFGEALAGLSANARLTTAKNGEVLMKILDESVPPAPDIIFLDINMPVKGGFECLEEIKQKPAYKGIPVVMLSTSCEKWNIDRAYSRGADYYICKPNSLTQLKSLINQVLSINWQDHKNQPSRDQFALS